MFVVGGSYKGFYLNQLKKIGKIDLLIFQQDIFYEFDYEQELLGEAVVSKELIYLNKLLNCPIVVYGESNLLGQKSKCLITCVNGKISIVDNGVDVSIFIKQKNVIISNKLFKYNNNFVTISLVDKKPFYLEKYKNAGNNYFICDKTGVTKIKNAQIYRKFKKYCYFSLPC